MGAEPGPWHVAATAVITFLGRARPTRAGQHEQAADLAVNSITPLVARGLAPVLSSVPPRRERRYRGAPARPISPHRSEARARAGRSLDPSSLAPVGSSKVAEKDYVTRAGGYRHRPPLPRWAQRSTAVFMASWKRISYTDIAGGVLSSPDRTAFSLVPSAFHRVSLSLRPLPRPHSFSIPLTNMKIKNTRPGAPVPAVRTPPKMRATTHHITRLPSTALHRPN
jgi:hypothetical protein